MLYFVIYAKISDRKKNGLKLEGIIYGGEAEARPEADALATKCADDNPNFIVITAVHPILKEFKSDLELATINLSRKVNGIIAKSIPSS